MVGQVGPCCRAAADGLETGYVTTPSWRVTSGGVRQGGARRRQSDLPVSQRTEDGGVQRPFHVVADPVDEGSGAGLERAVVSRADDGGACSSV
jgi:hypothetical protein